jgi:hypothetical protein
MLMRRLEIIYHRNVGRHKTILGAVTVAASAVYETATGAASELGGVVTSVLGVGGSGKRRGGGKTMTVDMLEMEVRNFSRCSVILFYILLTLDTSIFYIVLFSVK